jgi:hypothetical protein
LGGSSGADEHKTRSFPASPTAQRSSKSASRCLSSQIVPQSSKTTCISKLIYNHHIQPASSRSILLASSSKSLIFVAVPELDRQYREVIRLGGELALSLSFLGTFFSDDSADLEIDVESRRSESELEIELAVEQGIDVDSIRRIRSIARVSRLRNRSKI